MVVVGDVLVEDSLKVSAADDQRPIEALSTNRPDEPLNEGVGPWCPDRGAEDPDGIRFEGST